MGNVFEPDAYALTIGGATYSRIKIRRWQDGIGFRPARLWALLADQTPGSILRAALQGQPATFSLNGVLKMTGYCKTVIKSLRGRTVEVLITDYRQELDNVFIGQNHLGSPNTGSQPANGLPYIGADIWFNRMGLPNLAWNYTTAPPIGSGASYTNGSLWQPSTPDGYPHFCYEIPDDATAAYECSPANCAIPQGNFWNFGLVLGWIWANYVTAIPFPAYLLPSNMANWTNDLLTPCEPLRLLGVPAGKALEEVLARTITSCGLTPAGLMYFFTRLTAKATPPAVGVYGLNFVNEDTDASNANYNLTYPEEFESQIGTEDVTTDMQIIGGHQLRELAPVGSSTNVPPTSSAGHWNSAADTCDWYPNAGLTAYGDQEFVIRPIFPPLVSTVIGAWSGIRNWSNYVGGTPAHEGFGSNIRFTFRGDHYALHYAGKNIRRKDWGKRLDGALLEGRDQCQNYVNPQNECGIFSIGTNESFINQYPLGAHVDQDRAQVSVRRVVDLFGRLISPFDSPPNGGALPFRLETRQNVLATNNPDGLPTITRAVIRDEYVHETREAVQLIAPVDLTIITVGGSVSWSVTEAIALPTGWTRNYATSGTGSYPYVFTWTTPGGALTNTPNGNEVVVDGISPLSQIAALVQPELGRPSSNGRIKFPSYVSLPVGTHITATGGQNTGAVGGSGGYELVGDEFVIAMSYNGEEQSIEYKFSNYLGHEALELAHSFIDMRKFRRGA